jgi:hypothetical protein
VLNEGSELAFEGLLVNICLCYKKPTATVVRQTFIVIDICGCTLGVCKEFLLKGKAQYS